MPKLNRLTELLAIFTLVLLGHPDTASAQLFFSPSPAQLSISGPGGTAGPLSVNVSAPSAVTSLTINSINTTTGGNWLCAVVSSANTLNIYIGTTAGSCLTTTSTQLAANQSYTGTINVRDANFQTGTLNVNLTVGNGSGTGSGVAASPPSVSFIAPSGGQVGSQNVTVTVNGSATNITSFNFAPTSGVAFLNVSFSGATAILSVNNTNLSNGTYIGVLTLSTIFGSVNVQVTLTIGTGSNNGVAASPSSVSFSATPGGQVPPQPVSVTVNGAATAINSFSFTPTSGGVSFVSTSIAGSVATLSVNTTNLGNGVYTGVETLSTVFGSVNVNVTLTVSSNTSGLIANPNPVNFTLQSNGNAPSQNVTITLPSGTPVLITGISSTTNTGQNWLLPTIQAGVQGVVNVGVNGFSGPGGAFLSAGTYTGTVTVNTSSGLTTFQVNLTVGGIPTLQTNPTALNFAFQLGTGIPAPQNITVTSSGTPVNFTVSSSTNSGGTQWLIVSPTGQTQQTPGTITVSVQPAGLQGGVTYSGNIQINTFGGSSNATVNIPVNLLVSNSPILSAGPTSLNFTAQAGINPAAQILTLQSSSTPVSYTVTSSVTTPAGFNWLQVPAQSGATQATVTVGVVTAGLAPGTYSGTITITSPNAGNFSVSVPVTLTITAGAVLQLTPASLSFAYQIGQGQPPNQTINVASASGPVSITASAQTTSGGNWLSVSPTFGSAPGSLVASVNTSGLTAGTYNATITVTPSNGPAQTIPVTLVVSASALLVTSPSNVTFSAQQGATSSSFQNVAVTSTDGTAINFNVAVNYTSSATGWLFLNSSTGVTPSNLTITANPVSLGLGTYTATLTLTATSPANVANSPQVINVTLNVISSATLAVSPASLLFTQTAGGAAPASQTVSVTSSSGVLTFSAIATTNQGGGWLSVTPNNATTPGTLTVSVNGGGLPASPIPYTGQIVISSPGSSNPQLTVNVSLTVSNAVTVTVSPAALSPVSFQIGGQNPGTQTVAVSISGGGAATFTAVASTITGGNWLSVSPSTGTTPGNVVVTFNPAGLAASTIPYQGNVAISIAGATNSPVTLPITLTVAPAAQITPTVAAVQNAGSYLSSSISPGLVILIYGANMGPTALVSYTAGANGLIATNLSDTQVTFDGIPAPIVFTRNDLASVFVPYEIGGRASVSMIVSYRGAGSAPIQLRIVDAAPAIFTLSQTGTGQGAILNQNGTVNGAGNPEVAGNVIQIFGTGEGLTAPRGVTGSINPARLPLPAPILPITVTIGGVPVAAADIFYAGEAPGNPAGVIQINAKIPVGVRAGPQQVFFTVGGVPSQGNVTVSVR